MPDIVFTLDGRELTAQPGETILAVAARYGIEIPTLCFNRKISKTTSCFVCVVKDARTGKFLPSCSACPAPGQIIESSSDEVRDMRRTALGLLLSEHTGDCEAPCTMACPAHAPVEEYVRAGRNGDFLASLQIIKQRIPLPMSIGRVCPRFCEKDCRKNVGGVQPVSINDVKRIAADLFYETYVEETPPLNGKKVAVVGAGPAGLSAAYFLRLNGVASDLFEQMPEPGGMLRYGIPEFRLPKQILRKEIAHFAKLGGIQIRTGVTLGKDVTIEQLEKDYDAVIFAVGSWASSSMRIDGEDLAQQGIAWLGAIAGKNWEHCDNPGRTVVVGGGNTAMDCSRTALRLGGDVSIVYRRTKNEMPAEPLEIHEAEEEGVKFEYLTAPLSLRKAADGSLELLCQRMQLGEPDASGRRSPVPVPGSDFVIPADTVIAAIGQRTVVPDGLEASRRGIAVNEADLSAGAKNRFAAGDCVSGPATVVEAVAAGRKAALAALDSFADRVHEEPFLFNVSRGHWRSLAKDEIVHIRKDSDAARVQPDYIPMSERKTSFAELFDSIPAEKMSAEADRCIECSCTAKGDCFLKKHSTAYDVAPDMFRGAKPLSTVDLRHETILHDKQKCIRCGTCVKVCAEIVNKSLLALMKRGFNTQVETAFNRGLPSYCKDCGVCVQECPVGALDFKQKA